MFASFVDSTRFRYNSFHVREPSVNGIRFFVSLSLNDRRKPCLTNEPGLLFLLMLKDPATKDPKMQEERKRRRRRGKKEGKINRINALLPFLSGNFKSNDSILNSCERIQLYSTIIEIELSGSRWWQNR